MRPIPKTRAGRIRHYIQVMFPPLTYLPSTFADMAALSFGAQAIVGLAPARLGWRSIIGALTVVGFSLLMRVFDELKDLEHDRRLASAGDARYLDRPMVTGHVLPEDLRVLQWIVMGGWW